MSGIDKDRRDELQKQGLLFLAEAGEPQFTDQWFPYTSGEVGPYYIQSLAVTKRGDTYRWAIDAMCEIILSGVGIDGFDVVSGGESRDWDFSNPVAYALGKPHAKLYKDGTNIGADLDGKRVLHVADLNNEGSSVRDRWLPAVKRNGGSFSGAMFFIDRGEEGSAVMKQLSIPYDSVISMDEKAWKVLLNAGIINKTLFDSLNERLNDRRGWARKALKTNIDRLGEMLVHDNPKTVERAKKILSDGYPEIREELEGMLKQRGWLK